MKKQLLILTLFLTTIISAQTTAEVSIRLNPIQSIIVNTPNVLLDYTTVSDYINGVEVTKPDHLTVFSTGGFEVSITAQDNVLTGPTETIPVGDVNVLVSEGDNNPLAGVVYTGVNLTTSPQVLFSSSVGGVNNNFNVDYSAHGDYVGKAMEVYVVNVVYNINPL